MSEELACSDGAKMLIDRMKEHPEEFGPNGRWSNIINQMLEVRKGHIGSNFVSRRDMNALFEAYESYVMEPRLAERILNVLMEPKNAVPAPDFSQKALEDTLLQLKQQEYERAQRQGYAQQRPYSPRTWLSPNTTNTLDPFTR